MLGGADDDLLVGLDGDDTLSGEGGNDELRGGIGRDGLFGDAGNDLLLGGTDDDLLNGGDGDDVMGGESGNDALQGGTGRDALYGDGGDDRLDGGAGEDTLHGGAGADVFLFGPAGGRDIVLDFQSGVDRIDLSGIDANRTTEADDAFAFIGTGAFTNVAGQLRGEFIDGNTHLFGDTDGDGVADFEIVLNGAPVPVAADFVL